MKFIDSSYWRLLNHLKRTLCMLLLLPGLTGVANAALPIETWRTPQGVPVYFMQSPSIPMLDLEVRFDAGSWLDSADKVGVASLTASLLDAGAGERDEAQVADAFARIGALRSAWASDDSAGVRLRTLTSAPELEKSLELFRDMISHPAFSAAAFKRDVARSRQAIREADNRAGTLAARALYRLTYDKHPYAWRATQESLSRITIDDLREFHRKFYVRKRATIAIVGALDRSAAEKVASDIAESLKEGDEDTSSLEAVPQLDKATHEFIAHPGAQSHIYLGKPLIARGDPDYFALLVANNVLGGASFVSRLYKEIREKQGLAYSVSSGFSLARQRGLFTVSLQTQRDKTAQALESVRAVVRRFVKEGPTEKELDAARTNLAGGFVFRIDSNRKILSLLSAVGYHKLDLKYLDTWVDKINAVTLDQARAAVARHLDPDTLATVVVGKVDDLKP